MKNTNGRQNTKRQVTKKAPSSSNNSAITAKLILKITGKILGTVFLIAIALAFIAGSAAAGVFGGGLYGIIKTTPIVDAELFSSMGFNSYIYDAEGNIIAELKRMKTVSGLTMRIYLKLSLMPMSH